MKKILFSALILFCIPALLFSNPKTPGNPETGAGNNSVIRNDKTLDQVFNSINNGEKHVMARVRYIPRNDDALYVRWKMIEDAKNTIDCTYYIVDKDIFGQAFLGLLARKALEGVKIRLMVDGRIFRSGYMKGMPDRFQDLASYPNVQIKVFNSVLKSLVGAFTDFKGLFASNHDKIIVSDGKICITGGRNIGPDYFGQNGEFPIIYRDTDVVIEGAIPAGKMKAAFDAEWNGLRNSEVKPDLININDQKVRLRLADEVLVRYMHGKGLLEPAKTHLTGKEKKILQELNLDVAKFKNISSYEGYKIFSNEPSMKVKIVDKYSSLTKMDEISKCLLNLMDAAKEEIIIQNPYVVLTPEAEAGLRKASARGVKIVFHSNSGASTDSLFPQALLMNDWKKMLADMPTCRIFVAPSQNERLHSKTFVFDRKVTVIGSYNMDPLSQNSNSELVAVINDTDFSVQTYEQIQKDMEKVIEYKIKVEKDGTITTVYGPENHLSPELLKKMNLYRKMKWIRPVI